MVSLYEEIVGRGGVPPAYFFDRMDFAECAVYLNGMRRRQRAEMERTRLVMWACLSPWSKQRITPEDIMKLGEEPEHAAPQPADRESMERLRERARQMERKNG